MACRLCSPNCSRRRIIAGTVSKRAARGSPFFRWHGPARWGQRLSCWLWSLLSLRGRVVRRDSLSWAGPGVLVDGLSILGPPTLRRDLIPLVVSAFDVGCVFQQSRFLHAAGSGESAATSVRISTAVFDRPPGSFGLWGDPRYSAQSREAPLALATLVVLVSRVLRAPLVAQAAWLHHSLFRPAPGIHGHFDFETAPESLMAVHLGAPPTSESPSLRCPEALRGLEIVAIPRGLVRRVSR